MARKEHIPIYDKCCRPEHTDPYCVAWFFDGILTAMPSTVIQYFKYLPEKEVLQVLFRSGLVYEYEQVPSAVYEKMRAAYSKGKFLNEEIKGKFRFKKKEKLY